MTSSHTKESNKRGKKAVLIIAIILLSIIVLLAGTYLILVSIGKASLTGKRNTASTPSELVDDVDDDGTHITYNGNKYMLNPNAVSVLVLGVDKKTIKDELGAGKNGQADSIFVAVLDTKTGRVFMIPISRECMTEVKTYSSNGAYVGTEKMQLCLAYAYGNTGKDCCQNTAEAVQNLLYGMKIDAYVAIDMAGVNAITDAVGGVEVTTLQKIVTDEVYIPANKTVTLRGKKAEAYLRSRSNEVDANVMRLNRQKQFLNALFVKCKDRIRQKPTLIPSYYNVVKPYIVCDLDLAEVTYLAQSTLTAPEISLNYLDVKGETRMGEKHSEFYPDDTSLYEAILNAFYIKEE